jgi:hypothetical protein
VWELPKIIFQTASFLRIHAFFSYISERFRISLDHPKNRFRSAREAIRFLIGKLHKESLKKIGWNRRTHVSELGYGGMFWQILTLKTTHTEKVEKILLLISCPISPLCWHIKFDQPWYVKMRVVFYMKVSRLKYRGLHRIFCRICRVAVFFVESTF